MSVVGKQGDKEAEIGWTPCNWEPKKLSALVDVVYGKSPAGIKKLDSGIPIYGTGGISGYTDTPLSKGPSIILGRKGTIDKVQKCDGPFWAIDTTFYTSPKMTFDWAWLYYSISSFDLRKLNEASGVPSLSRGSLEDLDIPTPPLPEQKKIADILTAVDDKLDVIARQIEANQTLKQGLMQILFSRGVGKQDAAGRWVPHTEFKDSELGEIPVAWGVLSLSDVVDTLDKQRIPLKQADRALRRGAYPYYGASGVIDWIDDFIFDGDFILLGEDGENVLSRNLPLAFRATGKVWVNNHAHVFQPKAGFDIQFLVELLESLDYSHLASGTAQPKITQQALKQLRFAIPPYAEQKKIGAVLAGVEGKQAILSDKLTSYQTLKRGLMQKLLTGEWRVTLDAHQETAIAA